MTLAFVRRPTSEARPAARAASPITYTPPWKYRTTCRGSIPSTVISAVGTLPSAAVVTVTSAGSGCADSNSRSSRRCSLTSLPTGKAACRRIASRFSRCSVLTEDLLSGSWSSGVHVGAVAQVEADRFRHPGGRALGEVDRRGCDRGDLVAVTGHRRPVVLALLDEVAGRVDGVDLLDRASTGVEEEVHAVESVSSAASPTSGSGSTWAGRGSISNAA